jgi:hypothetical protein
MVNMIANRDQTPERQEGEGMKNVKVHRELRESLSLNQMPEAHAAHLG